MVYQGVVHDVSCSAVGRVGNVVILGCVHGIQELLDGLVRRGKTRVVTACRKQFCYS